MKMLCAAGMIAASLAAAPVMCVNAATPSVAALPGQPVDLTYAAEKAVPAVVHIKYVQNSKVQTVDVPSSPFDDFFGDMFGFGQGGGTQKRKVQTPKQEATGSGVIISADGSL